MSSLRKTYGFLFIMLMYLLLCVSYYIYVCLILYPQITTPQDYIFPALFHLVFVMQQGSLITVIFSDPGSVPLHWGFHVGDSETKRRRYCLMCHVFKPDRSHHCSVCNKCILNMDHHCPWINNCVGFHNRKSFLLTLLYSTLLAFFIACGSVSPAYTAVHSLLQSEGAWPELGYIGVCLCAVFFTLVIGAFLRFHVGLVLSNVTTIENLEKTDAHNSPSNYNLGIKLNWLQVFGYNAWLWLLPITGRTGKPAGDGLHWAYLDDNDFVEGSSKGNSDRVETPRLKHSSIISQALSGNTKIQSRGVSPDRSRVGVQSDIDTDFSFLNSRPRSAMSQLPDAGDIAVRTTDIVVEVPGEDRSD
jgi:palmitoyltransferase